MLCLICCKWQVPYFSRFCSLVSGASDISSVAAGVGSLVWSAHLWYCVYYNICKVKKHWLIQLQVCLYTCILYKIRNLKCKQCCFQVWSGNAIVLFSVINRENIHFHLKRDIENVFMSLEVVVVTESETNLIWHIIWPLCSPLTNHYTFTSYQRLHYVENKFMFISSCYSCLCIVSYSWILR